MVTCGRSNRFQLQQKWKQSDIYDERRWVRCSAVDQRFQICSHAYIRAVIKEVAVALSRSKFADGTPDRGVNDAPDLPPLKFDEMLEDSTWARQVPGLVEAMYELHSYADPERERLRQKAQFLVNPSGRMAHLTRALRIITEVMVVALGVIFVDWPRAALKARAGYAESPRQLLPAMQARRIRLAFERLGPTFVKFGQLIACMAGIVPRAVVEEFGKCRDEVPAVPLGQVEAIVSEELGVPSEVFDFFDPVPLAAASIAQVHAARLHDGREVVVKVQRPDIQRNLEDDISVLAHLVLIANRLFPSLKQANLHGVVTLFAEMVCEELDFRLEADSMCESALSLEFLEVPEVYIPHPEPGLISKRVLVMERLEGFKFADVEGMREAGINTKELVRTSMRLVVEGAAVAGIFHGDLHAGNVFVLPDSRFGLMDFGIVARFTIARRDALVRFLVSIVAEDPEELINAFEYFGAFPEGVDKAAIVRELEASGDEPPPEELSIEQVAEVLTRSIEIFARHGMHIPKDLIMFVKNLLYLNAATVTMAPDLDFFAEIQSVFDYFNMKYTAGLREIAGDVLARGA